MEVLIGILIIIVLIVAFWPVIELVFIVVLLSLITCAGGIVGMFLSLYACPFLAVWFLKAIGNLGRIVEVEFDDNNLFWFIDEELVKSLVHPFIAYLASSLLGIACMVGVLMVLERTGCFTIELWQEGPFKIKISEMAALYTVTVISCILFVIGVAITIDTCRDLFEDWMVARTNSLMTNTKKRIEGIEQLSSLEDSIHSSAGDLGISFPVCISEELQGFVQKHKMEVLSHPAKLNAYISRKIKGAKADELELRKAKKVYMKALQVYDETVHEVSMTGSIPILRELEQIYAGLTSPDLKSLIPERKWTEFMDVLDAISAELKRLSALAIRYREEVCHEDVSEEETLSDKERACRILGISASASFEEIKKIYHALANIYHGDKRIVQDDTRMKEINWAYKFLRNIKRS